MEHNENNEGNTNIKEEDDNDIENVINNTEITKELIEKILNDKEKHSDVLSLQANYKKAKDHFYANQFFQKEVFENNDNILFCDDCLNPIPPISETNKPRKYPLCSDTKNLAELGTGVYLYFYFIKFIFFMCALIFGITAVSGIIVAEQYHKQVKNYCNNNYDIASNSKAVCDDYNLTDDDWLYSMNFENLILYKKLVNSNKSFYEKDSSINVNLINFICMCVMYVINWVYIILMTNLDADADISVITAEDYTLMISDLPKNINFEELRTNYLKVDDTIPIEINPTYSMSEYVLLKNQFIALKKKLRYMYVHDLTELKSGCFGKNIDNIEDITRRLMHLDVQLNDWVELFDNIEYHPDKSQREKYFTGRVFATFKDCSNYENFKDKFPDSIFGNIWIRIKYYIFGCFLRERSKENTRKALDITVEIAPEPNDIKWENLETSNRERRKRLLLINLAVFFILLISFGCLFGISAIQKQIKKDFQSKTKTNSDLFVEYFVSLLFSIINNIFNYIITQVMVLLSNKEKNVSQTRYLLSLSIKLSIFTFLNTGPLPVLVNYATNDESSKQIIIKNSLFIFIINSISTPFMYIINPFGIIRWYKRRNIEKNIEKNPNYYIDMTQGELNTIFEYTDICLSFKYAYITKTIALVVFYLPILPLGAIISFGGLLLLYLIEKFNILTFYKRPEKIDGTITLTYVKLFRYIIFVYALSVYLFVGDIYKKQKDIEWELIGLVLFAVLAILPVNSVFKFLTFLDISDNITKSYEDVYFEIGMNYEMANPLSKHKGFQKYLDKLYKQGIVSQEEYDDLIAKIQTDPSDVIEAYYQKKYSKNNKMKSAKSKNLFKGLLKNKNYNTDYIKKEDALTSKSNNKGNIIGLNLIKGLNKEDDLSSQMNLKNNNNDNSPDSPLKIKTDKKKLKMPFMIKSKKSNKSDENTEELDDNKIDINFKETNENNNFDNNFNNDIDNNFKKKDYNENFNVKYD